MTNTATGYTSDTETESWIGNMTRGRRRMHQLDQLAQDWVEGRNVDDNHWIASQIVADEYNKKLSNMAIYGSEDEIEFHMKIHDKSINL